MNFDEFSNIVKVCRKNLKNPELCEVVFNDIPVEFINIDMTGSKPLIRLSDKLCEQELPF